MSRPDVNAEAAEVAERRIHATLQWTTLGMVILTHLLLVGSIWGQWRRIAIISGVFILAAVLNDTLARRVRFFSERARLADLRSSAVTVFTFKGKDVVPLKSL